MATHSSKYDPSEFVVPGSDQSGRNVRIALRVPPLLNRAIGDVRKSGKFPFETRDDIVLWHPKSFNEDARFACLVGM
jgi:hypothetical protein